MIKKLVLVPFLFFLGCPLKEYVFSGQVVDAESLKGLNGILVSCIISNGPAEWVLTSKLTDYEFDAGTEEISPISQNSPGWFYLHAKKPCIAFRFEDFTYGKYQTTEMTKDDFYNKNNRTVLLKKK